MLCDGVRKLGSYAKAAATAEGHGQRKRGRSLPIVGIIESIGDVGRGIDYICKFEMIPKASIHGPAAHRALELIEAVCAREWQRGGFTDWFEERSAHWNSFFFNLARFHHRSDMYKDMWSVRFHVLTMGDHWFCKWCDCLLSWNPHPNKWSESLSY
jgi:hypothetical protein